MSIQFKLFTLSVRDAVENEARLNLFLRQHRVLDEHREFVQDNLTHIGVCWLNIYQNVELHLKLKVKRQVKLG